MTANDLSGLQLNAGLAETTASPFHPALPKKLFLQYVMSLAFLLGPAILTIALKAHPSLHPIISLSFVVAISAAAWWGGASAGILASCATIPVLTLAATGGKALLPPHVDLLGIALFSFISVLVSRVATNRKRTEKMLILAKEQLESKVNERTAELQEANRALERAHSDLKSREEQIHGLANAIPQLSWMADGGGSVLWCNDRFVAYTGTSIDDIRNYGWTVVHDPEILPAVQARWQVSLATGQPFEMEFPLRGHAGKFRWFLTRVIPVADETGQVVRWFGAATDIDELKRSREALLESEARFRAMADAAPVLIWVSDVEKKFTWFNKSWLAFTGFTIEEQISRGWSEGIHPDDSERCIKTYAGSVDARESFALEYRRRRADGTWRWLLSNGVPRWGAAGDFLGYIGCCMDINDQKRTEDDLRQANNDLQQFAYSASHDLREPIRTVVIYSQLVQRRYGSKLDETAQSFLDYVTSAALRMEKLVHDLLLYTQAGDIDTSVVTTSDANEALKAALENLSASVSESGAVIVSDPLPTVKMDSVHLQQLFQNLVGNGIKYRGDVRPYVRISAHEQNAYWVFSVQDNGIGIDPAYKNRIFEIFRRLHTHEKYSGTGIGLAICQRIIQRYRGRIWVESEPGKGATFFFAVPV